MNPIVFKVFQGNHVGSSSAGAVAVFDACLSLDGETVTLMHSFSDCDLRNCNGIDMGALRTSDAPRHAHAADVGSQV